MSAKYTLYEFEDHYRLINNDCLRATKNAYHRIEKNPSNEQVIEDSVDAGLYQVRPGSEYESDYIELRVKSKEQGGYGSTAQQLELLYDKIKESGGTSDQNILDAIREWVTHIDTVKANNPKPAE